MELNRTGSTWDRANRNGINDNWSKLENLSGDISSKVDEYTEFLNSSMEHLLNDEVTPVFEMGNWYNAGTPDNNNNLRMRATRPYYLKRGMEVKPTPSENYQYQLIFHVNGEPTGEKSGWIMFDTPYVMESGRESYIIIRKSPEAVVQASDLTNVNTLFGAIRSVGKEVEKETGLFELGSFYFSSGNNYNPGQRIRQKETVRLSAGQYINTFPNNNLEFRAYGYVNGVYQESSPDWRTFGQPLEIPFSADYRVLVRPTTGRDFYKYDVGYVDNNFFIEDKRNDFRFIANADFSGTSKFDIVDDIEHDFESFDLYDYHTRPKGVSTNELYGEYERIRALDNTYITRRELGKSVGGRSIYEYKASPIALDGGGRGVKGVQPRIPKIVLLAGVHGDERSTAFSAMELLELVSTKWRENKLLEFLRFNVEIVIVPLVNPDGFNAATRRNTNNVDINRDMPNGWYKVSSGYAQNGTEPLSQPETQILYNFLLEHSDASLVIDFHTTSIMESSGLQQLGYASTSLPELSRTMNKSLSNSVRQWQKKYSYLPQDPNSKLMYVADSPAGGGIIGQATSFGINATLLEMCRSTTYSPEGLDVEYTQDVNSMTTDVIINTLKSWLKAHAL